jgi:putative ABC transport system permease protein
VSARNLIWFWWRRVRVRRVQELFALIGIAVGVALLYAVQISNESLSASVARLSDGVVGDAQLQLKARDSHGLDASLVGRAAAIDGVRAAAPVLEVQANMAANGRERSITLLASDPNLERLDGELVSGYSLQRLAQLRAIVLPERLAESLDVEFGDAITVQAGGHAVQAPVATVINSDELGALASSPIAVTSLRYGQELAGMEGRVSRVFVAVEPGRMAAVQRRLEAIAGDRVDVRATDVDGRVFAQLAMPNDNSTRLFAAISALVGFLFAFNAMLVMAKERRNLIAEMRMSGFRARTVAQVLLFDALALGAVASVLGIALGELLSRSVFEPDPGYLAIAFPVGSGRVVEPATAVLAFAAGLLAAATAALVPLLGTYLSRSPMDSARDDGLERAEAEHFGGVRWPVLAAGAACLAVSALVLAFAPEAAMLGMATLVVAMLLSLRAILAAALTLLDRVRRGVTSVVPVIAIGELRSASTRSVAIAAIAAIAVFGTTAILGARADLQRGLDPNARELSDVTDLWVTPRGDTNLLATIPFAADEAVRTIATTPQVAAVQIYRGSFLDTGDRRLWVIAPPRGARSPIPPSQIVDGDLRLATERLREGGWAVASEAVAKQEGLKIGRPFRLDSPRPTTLRLAAITTNFGWSPGALIVNADDYRSAWRSRDASALEVDLATGVSLAAGQRAVEQALGPGAPYTVQTAVEREESFRSTTRAGLSRLDQIATLLLVAAVLAIAAATAAMIWQRRRRLADLKLTGITPASLWKALVLESALLLSIGSTIGAAFGLLGQQLLDRALNAVTGFPVDYSVGVAAALGSLGLVTVIALAIAAVPGWYAARVPANVAFDG